MSSSWPRAVRFAAWTAILAVVASSAACLFGRGSRDAEGGAVRIEYVPIAIAWVRRHVPVEPAAVAAWSASDAGKSAVGSEIRHVLVAIEEPGTPREIAAARKRARQVVARIARGDDLLEVVREESDDDRTRDSGGSLGRDVASLPEPLRATAQSLAPGEMATEPVRSTQGFHVLIRDDVDAAQINAAYRKARASELARKLADELLSRMQSSSEPIETIFEEGVAAILGQAAVADPKRHKSVSVSREGAADADLPEDAREGLAAFARKASPGDITDTALGTGPVLVVARAVAAK